MIKLFEDIFALLGSLCLLVNLALLAIWGIEEIVQLKKKERERNKLLEEFQHRQAGDTDD